MNTHVVNFTYLFEKKFSYIYSGKISLHIKRKYKCTQHL